MALLTGVEFIADGVALVAYSLDVALRAIGAGGTGAGGTGAGGALLVSPTTPAPVARGRQKQSVAAHVHAYVALVPSTPHSSRPPRREALLE